MRLQRRIFFVDVDGTLINADLIKSLWESFLGDGFNNAYRSSKKLFGYLKVDYLSKSLHADRKFFYDMNFKQFLYPHALSFLKRLKKGGNIVIFTQGDRKYQKRKLEVSGITDIVGEDCLSISKDKKSRIKKTVEALKNKYSTIFFIDDKIDILKEADMINPQTATISITHNSKNLGSTKKDKDSGSRHVNFYAASLPETFWFTKRFVASLPQNVLDCKLSVVKGLDDSLLNQLVKFTGSDTQIKKFTRDKERFSDSFSARKWLKGKRHVYALTNSERDLLGIIWLERKSYRKYNYTFAIRLYRPARGKGLAKKFMEIAEKESCKKDPYLKCY